MAKTFNLDHVIQYWRTYLNLTETGLHCTAFLGKCDSPVTKYSHTIFLLALYLAIFAPSLLKDKGTLFSRKKGGILSNKVGSARLLPPCHSPLLCRCSILQSVFRGHDHHIWWDECNSLGRKEKKWLSLKKEEKHLKQNFWCNAEQKQRMFDKSVCRVRSSAPPSKQENDRWLEPNQKGYSCVYFSRSLFVLQITCKMTNVPFSQTPPSSSFPPFSSSLTFDKLVSLNDAIMPGPHFDFYFFMGVEHAKYCTILKKVWVMADIRIWTIRFYSLWRKVFQRKRHM